MTAVEALLHENKLPTQDLAALHANDFLYCGNNESPTGVIGLQVLGSLGLLRSLVVSKAGRRQGCGNALVSALESNAKQAGIFNLYLLTETAESYFTALKYTTIRREYAPREIKSTEEFSGLCSDNATLMYKQLVIADWSV